MEGMSEAELTLLTQQTVALAYIVGASLALFFFLYHRDEQGRSRWARLRDHFTVKRSEDEASAPTADYVAPAARPASVSIVSPLVTEAETEAETDETAYTPPPGAAETAYIRVTQKQLDEVKARAFLEGAAHAVGTLQGAGYLDAVVSAERLTDAKRAVFGGSGRRLNSANALIAQAAAKAAPAEEDRRLVPLDGGQGGYIEL